MIIHLFSQPGAGTQYTRKAIDFYEPHPAPHTRQIEIPEDARFLYLMRHPLEIIASMERRGFIDNEKALATFAKGQQRLRGDGLEDYIAQGEDLINFGDHFNCFYRQKAAGMFVRYPYLIEGIKKFAKWTNAPLKIEPKFQPGPNYTESLNAEQVETLMHIHGDWATYYNKLPGVFINKKSTNLEYQATCHQ